MTTDSPNDTGRMDGSDNDIDVAALLNRAGRRPNLSIGENAQLRAVATRAWQAEVHKRRATRVTRISAIAATLVLGVALLWQTLGTDSSRVAAGVQVATVLQIDGPPAVAMYDNEPTSLLAGATIETGRTLMFATGSVASLQLANGMEMRVSGPASLTAAAADDWSIDAGRIYLDSRDDGTAARSVRVQTAHAVIRDIGTRFQVIAEPEGTEVLVRDGYVTVTSDTREERANGGERLRVSDIGQVSRSAVRPDDALWDWTLSVVSNPDLEGKPVLVLLKWVAHETGKRLRFASADVEREVKEHVLRGAARIGEMTPLEALAAGMLAADLDYELTGDGVIFVKYSGSQAKH